MVQLVSESSRVSRPLSGIVNMAEAERMQKDMMSRKISYSKRYSQVAVEFGI